MVDIYNSVVHQAHPEICNDCCVRPVWLSGDGVLAVESHICELGSPSPCYLEYLE